MDAIVSGTRKKRFHKRRRAWWISQEHVPIIVDSPSEREHAIGRRQLLMLRRATISFYFSCEQLQKILTAIPSSEHHVEAIVTVFSRLTDIENLDCGKLLGHDTFDKDGNGCVMWDELQHLKSDESPDVNTRRYLELCERIGQANLFNPLFPEREYALDLKTDLNHAGDNAGVHDERKVTECIIILSAEPGDNTLNETFNGLPFEVENRWSEVPRTGIFCTTYQTRKNGGLLSLRLPLCRALLLPGKGRWKSPKAEGLFDPTEDAEQLDSQVEDWEGEWMLDADGCFLRKSEVEARKAAAALEEGPSLITRFGELTSHADIVDNAAQHHARQAWRTDRSSKKSRQSVRAHPDPFRAAFVLTAVGLLRLFAPSSGLLSEAESPQSQGIGHQRPIHGDGSRPSCPFSSDGGR